MGRRSRGNRVQMKFRRGFASGGLVVRTRQLQRPADRWTARRRIWGASMVSKARNRVAAFVASWALLPGAALALPPGVCNPNQPLSGAKLYAENCASCHGADAKGGKTPNQTQAPDLTALARGAGGAFPAPKVSDTIRYGGALPDHNSAPKMAIWAEVFHHECGPTYSRRVVVELTKYLEGLQK